MRIARRRFGAAVLPILAPPTLRALSRSWKVETIGAEHFERWMAARGRIATMWHGRMLVPMPAHKNLDMSVLVSPSDDGSLVTMMLGRFGYGTIRGSSNKNPARALREMLDRLEEGATVVITPDGPRGPRHGVNPGPAWMARATGFPILPCGFVCHPAWNLKSWDRFTIPRFGARIALVYGEPIFVPEDASDDDLTEVTEEMKSRMMDAEERGYSRLGVEPDW